MTLMERATHMLQWEEQRVMMKTESILNTFLNSDWKLQFASMKLESLVIADQNAAVNTFPGLVHTARHTMGVGCTRSR